MVFSERGTLNSWKRLLTGGDATGWWSRGNVSYQKVIQMMQDKREFATMVTEGQFKRNIELKMPYMMGFFFVIKLILSVFSFLGNLSYLFKAWLTLVVVVL